LDIFDFVCEIQQYASKESFFSFHNQTPMIDFGIPCFPLQFEEKTSRGNLFFPIPTFGNPHYFTKFKICCFESPL
jgi:hypothetical protein